MRRRFRVRIVTKYDPGRVGSYPCKRMGRRPWCAGSNFISPPVGARPRPCPGSPRPHAHLPRGRRGGLPLPCRASVRRSRVRPSPGLDQSYDHSVRGRHGGLPLHPNFAGHQVVWHSPGQRAPRKPYQPGLAATLPRATHGRPWRGPYTGPEKELGRNALDRTRMRPAFPLHKTQIDSSNPHASLRRPTPLGPNSASRTFPHLKRRGESQGRYPG